MNRDARRAEKRKRRGAAALAILMAATLAIGTSTDDVAIAGASDDLYVYGGGGGGGGGGSSDGGGGGGGGYIQLGNKYASGNGAVGGTADGNKGKDGSSGQEGGNGGNSNGGVLAGSGGGQGVGNPTSGLDSDVYDAANGSSGNYDGSGGNGGGATVEDTAIEARDLYIVAGNGGSSGGYRRGGSGGNATVIADTLTLYGNLSVASGEDGADGSPAVGGAGGSASLDVGTLTAARGTHEYYFEDAAEATGPPPSLDVDIDELVLEGDVTMKFGVNASFDDLFNHITADDDDDLTTLTFSGGSLTIMSDADLSDRELTVAEARSGEVLLIQALHPDAPDDYYALSGVIGLNAHPNQIGWKIINADGEAAPYTNDELDDRKNNDEKLDLDDLFGTIRAIYAVFPSNNLPPVSPQTAEGKFIVVYGIKVYYTIDTSGVVSVDLDAALLDSIVKAAYEDNKDNKAIGFDFTVVKALTGFNVTVPPSWFEDNADITLAMLTGIGGVNIDRNAADKFPEPDAPGVFTLRRGSLILAASQNGKAVTWDSFNDPVVIYVPYTPKYDEAPGTVALFDKKTNEIVANSFYRDGRVYGAVCRPGEYEAAAVPISIFGMADHWALDDVMFTVSHGLLEGDSTGGIYPDAAITRADFLIALCKLSGADVSGYTVSSFLDVADDDPAMPYIEWAAENEIVYGVGDDMFAPLAPIAREEAAVMMGRYAAATGRTLPRLRLSELYADQGLISGWATRAVAEVQRANVITGRPESIYDPRGDMTRAEASAIVRRFTESVTLGRMGWVQNDEGAWLYIKNDYLSVKGWFTDADENKYWFDEDGIRAEDMWIEIDGAWYYLYEDGKLAVDTTVDGYTIGMDGKRQG